LKMRRHRDDQSRLPNSRHWRSRRTVYSTSALILLATAVSIGITLSGSKSPSTVTNSNSGQIVVFSSSRGAEKTESTVSTSNCVPSDLSTHYWTTLPESQGLLASGFTVTNVSQVDCNLPTQVSNAAIGLQGLPIVQSGFQSGSQLSTLPSGTTPQAASASTPGPEFMNMQIDLSNGISTIDFGQPSVPVVIQPITLNSGGEAVVVISSYFNPDSVENDCLAAPSGGSLLVTLPGGVLNVPIPLMPAPSGGSENSTGSVFYECGPSAISPFVTWAQAAQMVGGSSVLQGSSGTVPGLDNSIFSLAP
jgi:hypothetical protein